MAEAEKSGMLARKDWRIVAAAIVLGALSVVLMNVYVKSREKAEVLESVVVASRQIDRGTPLTRGLLTTKDLPRGALAGNYVPGKDLDRIANGVSALAVAVTPEQPIYWNFITVDVPKGMERYAREGERLFTMNFSSPLADAVTSGDLIDIYGIDSRGGDPRAFQILAAVTVVTRAGGSLVLSVTPEEALLLTVAGVYRPTFTLRSKQETDKDTLEPISAGDIVPKAKDLTIRRYERIEQSVPKKINIGNE